MSDLPTPIKKPPLGLIPSHIAFDHWREERLDQVRKAIDRYLMDGETPIPTEWITEYNDLVSRLHPTKET